MTMSWAWIFWIQYLRDYPYKQNALLKSTFHKLEGAKRKAAGAAFTDFALADMQGVSRKLSDYAGKGHYVLVDFGQLVRAVPAGNALGEVAL